MRFLPVTLAGDNICQLALNWIKHLKKNTVITLWFREYRRFYCVHLPCAESRWRSEKLILGMHQVISCRIQHWRSQRFSVQVLCGYIHLQAPLAGQKGSAAVPAQPAQWNRISVMCLRQNVQALSAAWIDDILSAAPLSPPLPHLIQPQRAFPWTDSTSTKHIRVGMATARQLP